MRAGAMSTNLLVTIGALGHLRNTQSIVSPACGGAPLGMPAFRIGHSSSTFLLCLKICSRTAGSIVRANFSPQRLQLAPAIVYGFTLTAAISLIAILSAYGADALARFIANQLHGKRQKDNFAQNILQRQPVPLVIAYFNAGLMDLFLAAASCFGGHIEQIELIFDGESGGFEATIASSLHRNAQRALNANFPHRMVQ